MRIAIIGSRGFPYVYSGYETFVAELAPRLIRRGHRVLVYCHRELFPQRPTVAEGVELVYVRGLPTKTLSQLSHGALSTLDLMFRRVDVVLYVNSANGPWGFFTRLRRVASCINVDGVEWRRPKWKGLGARYFYWASSVATRVFDKVITDSREMARIYAMEFGAASTVIPYGSGEFGPVDAGLLRRFGIAPREHYLIVGRLVPDNNADLIVKGFRKCATRKKLVVVGDVPYRDEFVDSVKASADERVVFPGYVRDQNLLRELYSNCYVYVHGHEYGGTNPSMLTALGCGCAVLALDTPFNREMLVGDRHGLFFSKDVNEVTRELHRCEEHPEVLHALRATARERIHEEYDWEKVVSMYEEVFSQVTGERR
jgi:glycosyltransferase involved in cell wall biosynthesis